MTAGLHQLGFLAGIPSAKPSGLNSENNYFCDLFPLISSAQTIRCGCSRLISMALGQETERDRFCALFSLVSVY
jgi:hypothetical protein